MWKLGAAHRTLRSIALAAPALLLASSCSIDDRSVRTQENALGPSLNEGDPSSSDSSGDGTNPASREAQSESTGAQSGDTGNGTGADASSGAEPETAMCEGGTSDDRCPEVACPGDDVCRDYVEGIAAGTCAGPGRCAAAEDCSFVYTPVARAGEACSCVESRCGLRLGEPCGTPGDCASGACALGADGNSVCCASPCSGTEVCTATGSNCVLGRVCGEGETRCLVTDFQVCFAGQWSIVTGCGERECDATVGCIADPLIGFDADIHPILVASCGGCHASAPGREQFANANVDLAYEEALGVADEIVQRLGAGTMPPQCGGAPPGSPGCVSEEELALIQAWNDLGLPR